MNQINIYRIYLRDINTPCTSTHARGCDRARDRDFEAMKVHVAIGHQVFIVMFDQS